MTGPQIAWLADGRRLHLNHGPIDLIIEAFGEEAERRAAYEQAIARFDTVLTGLVEELAELRRPATATTRAFHGVIAQRMERAVCRHAPAFITPMAAVAGAVADEMLAAMCTGRRLEKAYVNDGGDIAIHLAEGAVMKAAIAGTGHGFADRIMIGFADPVRGIATSGWRGRSYSLGIADAVTVLAKTAAEADAAATLIANAVDLPGHPTVRRVPACDLAPDSDLGDRPVTVDVGPLKPGEIASALGSGFALAEEFWRRGLIEAAALFLGGDMRFFGTVALDDTPLKRSRPITAHTEISKELPNA
ncbi:UPF0280 family protein [Pseudaminobacter arsenicus]|uniref:UPF0280 family protein n=1 Tax=Borborobacter arsenicus TaxID=1851146 RepID=A0A432V4F8_9HYPH|nr:UPF0280 family protein [Pseudaminobacter arsenicus]RUM97046.1 UPF0280 family protein [Pseudaminobacter arsenicus]